jgi:phosphopantothenoylcysteine decarboxylase/phosphopantothenate--cysteine ligase
MRILITAGPTREYIDTVRFLSNASSGRMGLALGRAALEAGHDVTLLLGPVSLEAPEGAEVVPFVSCSDLAEALGEQFPRCDVLMMAAAVGDFRPERTYPSKLHRRNGPITLRLYPTEDILATVAQTKRADQTIVSFSVEDGRPEQVEAKAREEMLAKHADLCVVNPPAAMADTASEACVLDEDGIALPWARREKSELARQIVKLLGD